MKKIIAMAHVIFGLTIVAAAQEKHYVGEKWGGGIVFYVTLNELHGLITETIDQSKKGRWYDAQDKISDPFNHSAEGKNFTDWRLPTKFELNLLYNNKTKVDGLSSVNYWSSSEFRNDNVWIQNFVNGVQSINNKNEEKSSFYIRAVRSF